MDSIFSLNRVAATPRDLKAEASATLGRDPQGEAARKRNRRRQSNQADDEFEVDTFEHVEGEPQDR